MKRHMDDSATDLPPALEAEPLTGANGVRHGFFTRAGGCSDGLYASLNCGLGSGDDPAAVTENRRRVARAIGVGADRLITAYQVHGIDVATIDRAWGADERPKVDGMVTRTPGIALGVLAADCAPVLFADSEAGIIGACHAGWRGALAGVVEATVAAMERLGADRGRMRAGLGPCIAQKSYEVGTEFRANFIAADPANAAFFADGARPGHFMFDLPGYVLGRIARARVGEIGHVALDTCAEEARLFSFRRSCLRGEGDFGRGLSAIALAAD
jgi:YfiH family protein